jgi:hypothetical protein
MIQIRGATVTMSVRGESGKDRAYVVICRDKHAHPRLRRQKLR